MYDNYVSLGKNCEIAFQFRRILGKDVAYYFNWLVTPLDSLIRIISNDFAGAFEKHNLEAFNDGMVLDHAYGMRYHSPFRNELGTNLSGERFHEIHAHTMGKIELFKQRFRSLAGSQNRVLYFIKSEEPATKDKAIKVRDLLAERYPTHDFELLVLQTEEKRESPWSEARIHNRYLERFAPFDKAPDGHVPSWDRIFAEFPLKPGAMQTPV